MILLVGIPSEPPLAMVHDACHQQGFEHRLLSQRDSASWAWDQEFLSIERAPIDLASVRSVYVRMADHTALPEREDADQETAARIDSCHQRLWQWLDATPACVVNRPAAMTSNGSKPFQAQIIATTGFLVPETLVTTDPSAAEAFIDRHYGSVIYKSTSAARSIVRRWRPEDADRLLLVRHCPTQFQEWVDGVDVRVHVVGESVFATEVQSTGDDYRYAVTEGGQTHLRAIDLPADLVLRCRTLAAHLRLAFAGIDLRMSRRGVFCLEVNPSPAFSYYEQYTGQPIARAVASLLAA